MWYTHLHMYNQKVSCQTIKKKDCTTLLLVKIYNTYNTTFYIYNIIVHFYTQIYLYKQCYQTLSNKILIQDA